MFRISARVGQYPARDLAFKAVDRAFVVEMVLGLVTGCRQHQMSAGSRIDRHAGDTTDSDKLPGRVVTRYLIAVTAIDDY